MVLNPSQAKLIYSFSPGPTNFTDDRLTFVRATAYYYDNICRRDRLP